MGILSCDSEVQFSFKRLGGLPEGLLACGLFPLQFSQVDDSIEMVSPFSPSYSSPHYLMGNVT